MIQSKYSIEQIKAHFKQQSIKRITNEIQKLQNEVSELKETKARSKMETSGYWTDRINIKESMILGMCCALDLVATTK